MRRLDFFALGIFAAALRKAFNKTSAVCNARRLASCSICSRQLKPSAITKFLLAFRAHAAAKSARRIFPKLHNARSQIQTNPPCRSSRNPRSQTPGRCSCKVPPRISFSSRLCRGNGHEQSPCDSSFGNSKLRMLDKKFADGHRIFRKPVRVFVVGKKAFQFVAKNRNATRFQTNNRNVRANFFAQRNQNIREHFFGVIQHSKIIKRPPATKFLFRQNNLVPGRFQNQDRRLQDFGMKMIVERVHPKHDRRVCPH